MPQDPSSEKARETQRTYFVMTSVHLYKKTQTGTDNIHPVQENVPPRRLTRLEKARQEALEAFGNCGFDAMVVKRSDFRAKLKASASTSKPLKRKNQELNNDGSEVLHRKKPARELTSLGKSKVEHSVHKTPHTVKETSEKVGHNYGGKRANVLGMSAANHRVRPHSSLASRKRMTRVERARLEAMQSFGEQGLDTVWKSCTQIMSKMLEKREEIRGNMAPHVQRGADNRAEATLTSQSTHTMMEGETSEEARTDEGRFVEKQVTFGVETSKLLVGEAEKNATSKLSTNVQDPYHCNNKKSGQRLTRVQKAQMEALQSFSGQKFDEVNKTSTRIMAKYLTPGHKNEVTNTEPCEENSSSGQGMNSNQYPKQRIDLFSNIHEASFVDRETLLLTNKRVVETARDLETPSPKDSLRSVHGQHLVAPKLPDHKNGTALL